MSDCEVRAVDAAAVRPLRQALLRPHQRVEELVYPGDDHPETLHVGAFRHGHLVGVATIVSRPMPGRRELQSLLMAQILSPGSALASALAAPAGRVAGALKALAEKLEKEQPAPAAEAKAEAPAPAASAADAAPVASAAPAAPTAPAAPAGA